MEDIIKNLSIDIAEKLSKSSLKGKFIYKNELIELRIALPSLYPPVTSLKLEQSILNSIGRNKDDIYIAQRSCPSIERIDMDNSIQNKGLFTAIVSEILKLDFVECVCIQNVSNNNLLNHFIQSDKWSLLLSPKVVSEFRHYSKAPSEIYEILLDSANRYLEEDIRITDYKSFKCNLIDINKNNNFEGDLYPKENDLFQCNSGNYNVYYLGSLGLNNFYTTMCLFFREKKSNTSSVP